MGATAAIAEFIAKTSTADFPPDSLEKAKKAIADTFAVIIAGAGSEVAEPLRKYLAAAHAPGSVPSRSRAARCIAPISARRAPASAGATASGP